MYIEYYADDGRIKYLGDNNELFHYNHNHDALGRFAGKVGGVASKSASSPKQYQKKANKLEKLSSDGRAKAMKKEYKSTILSEKGKNKKSKELKKEAQEYKKLASQAKANAKKTAGEAFSKKHYNVSESKYLRNTEMKRDVAVLIADRALVPTRILRVGTVAGYYAASNSIAKSRYGDPDYGGENPRQMVTTKYSVKKKKK